jgi:hypothetical protein
MSAVWSWNCRFKKNRCFNCRWEAHAGEHMNSRVVWSQEQVLFPFWVKSHCFGVVVYDDCEGLMPSKSCMRTTRKAGYNNDQSFAILLCKALQLLVDATRGDAERYGVWDGRPWL